jgi:hypothetical protein
VSRGQWNGSPRPLNLGFIDRSRYFFIQAAPQLPSRGWMDPVPDLLLLRKSGSAGNRTRDHLYIERESGGEREQACMSWVSNGRMIGEYELEIMWDKCGHSLNWSTSTIPEFAWEDGTEPWRTSLRMVDAPAEIRTGNFPNTSQEICYLRKLAWLLLTYRSLLKDRTWSALNLNLACNYTITGASRNRTAVEGSNSTNRVI